MNKILINVRGYIAFSILIIIIISIFFNLLFLFNPLTFKKGPFINRSFFTYRKPIEINVYKRNKKIKSVNEVEIAKQIYDLFDKSRIYAFSTDEEGIKFINTNMEEGQITINVKENNIVTKVRWYGSKSNTCITTVVINGMGGEVLVEMNPKLREILNDLFDEM